MTTAYLLTAVVRFSSGSTDLSVQSSDPSSGSAGKAPQPVAESQAANQVVTTPEHSLAFWDSTSFSAAFAGSAQ